MKTEDIKIGDLIEFTYDLKVNTRPKIKGLVTAIVKKQDTDFAIFTIRDEDKNSPTYYQYIKYEERKMKDIQEVLELSKPLTDREKVIIDFYEDRIMDMQSEVADEIQEARDSVDELLEELSDLEDEVVGDLQEDLIEYLEEQEAEERRKSIQDIVGKDK
jgi:hypothetical protein